MSESPTRDHNVKARSGVIKSACSEITALEAKRKAISEEIRAVKQTKIKGDLGMKIADFNAALRLYGLEDANRTVFFDTLRETFNALGVGGQLNFLTTVEKANGEDADETGADDDFLGALEKQKAKEAAAEKKPARKSKRARKDGKSPAPAV